MLELASQYVSFEPDTRTAASANTTVNFFDAATSRICTMRNNGGLGVTCKSLNPNDVISARTKDRGPAMLLKLSPNGKLAVLQRQQTSVDIVFMDKSDGSGVAIEFNLSAKSKEPICEVEWMTNSQILIVTKQCLELVNILEEKRSAKSLRTTNIAASWSTFFSQSNLLVVATGANSATLQPIVIHHGQFTRLKSFDVEFASPSSKENLLEKDVSIASIYGKIYVMVLRHSGRNNLSSFTDLALFELSSDATVAVKLKYTLILGCNGAFGIHVIDNLILIHHQASANSMIFDVGMAPNRPSHTPLVTTSIKAGACAQPHLVPALYTPMWSMFQPDVIADSLAGLMYRLVLRCDQAEQEIEDKCARIEFLMHRTDQAALVIKCLSQCLSRKELSLRQVRKLFNILAEKHTTAQIPVLRPSDPTKSQLIPVPARPLRIEQQQLHSSLFIPLKEDCLVDKIYLSNVMLQYLRSLHKAGETVDPYFLEILVESLADAGEMTKLHQLVTYRVISDSKPLAFLLLCFEARCPQLFQSGVDILARRRAVDEIVEVLLEKGFVVDAVRFLDAQQGQEGGSMSAKLLEAAAKKERLVHLAVAQYLPERRGSRENLASLLYNDTELTVAEKEVALCTMFHSTL